MAICLLAWGQRLKAPNLRSFYTAMNLASRHLGLCFTLFYIVLHRFTSFYIVLLRFMLRLLGEITLDAESPVYWQMRELWRSIPALGTERNSMK